MNVFCTCIKGEIKKVQYWGRYFHFKDEKLVHFAFNESLVSYHFFHDMIELVSLRWEERKIFFANN